MGQAASQPIHDLFNVGSDNEFQVKVTLFLSKDYVNIYPVEARKIIQHDKFSQLLEVLIDKMHGNDYKVIQNSLRHLSVFIPILLAEHHALIVSNNPKVEVEVVNRLTVVKVDEDVQPLEAANLAQPRIYRIIDNLIELLFKPGFTIQGKDKFSLDNDPRLKSLLKEWLDRDIKIRLENIWRGLATLTKYPNDQKQYYENRVLVLSCLLACLQEQLYNKEPQSSQALSYLAFEDHCEVFASLWAVILFHKHGYFWFQDNLLIQQKTCRYMAILSAQVLLIVLAFNSELNQFRKIVIETKLLDYSFDLLIENMQQSLISDSKLITTRLHDNNGVQEFMGLLYFLLTQNKHAHDFIIQMSVKQISDILTLLLYYITQFMDNQVNYDVYQISLELLDYLLGYENIGKISQRQMEIQFKVGVLPLIQGTYQDCILSYYSHLLLLDFSARTEYFIEHYKSTEEPKTSGLVMNYRSDLLCKTLYKLSFYTRCFSSDAAALFDRALKKYFLYEFVFINGQQAKNQELLIVATLNYVRQGSWTVLQQLMMQNPDLILKFKVTNNKMLKFFKQMDLKEQRNLNKEIVETEQMERFKLYLQIWSEGRKRLEGIQVDQLKTVVSYGFQLLASASKNIHVISNEEFEKIYQLASWIFIPEIGLVLDKSHFQLEKYAFNLLRQQLEYMPMIDLEKCVYI